MSRFRSSNEPGGSLFLPYLMVLIFIFLESVPNDFFVMAQLKIGLYFAPLFFIGLAAGRDPRILASQVC